MKCFHDHSSSMYICVAADLLLVSGDFTFISRPVAFAKLLELHYFRILLLSFTGSFRAQI